ncbi:MAG: VWA domain-containing protein [Armatimonadetes bacterium]|nr:VWA domain-containing protein [Armatimonadota bacterium]
MRFLAPWWALMMLPVVVGLFWSWRHVYGMAKGRKRFAFVVRAVLASLLVMALMGPQTRQVNRGIATMFVVDRSDSVSDEDKQAADRFVGSALQKLGGDDLGGVVAFGSQAVLDSAPSGRRTFGGIQSKVDGSSSDLAAAVRLAAATMPEGKAKRIVVLSDGNENRGDVAQAAEVAATESIELDTVPLGTKPKRAEASVLEMRTPNERRANEPFQVKVVAESTVAQPATLVIDRDGMVVAKQPVMLDQGKTTLSLDQKLEAPGFYRYRATLLVSQDTDHRNNVGASFTTVKGKPKVLLVQGDRTKQELAQALAAQGIDVRLYGPEGLPVRAEDLQSYDAVLLNDLNASLVTNGQMKLLQGAVRDTGVGFAMIGGENSFLPGGWYGTPVAEALPVDLNIRQRKSFPSTTVLVVIDASGSMGAEEDGVQKIQLAAKAAEETVKLLSPLDRVGVAGSSDGIELVAPVQELKDKPKVISQIKKLRPGMGGIYAEPSVQFADKTLRGENTKVRHFLLLADGNDVDTYGDTLGIVGRLRSSKITTSVVAIGDGKDVPFLKTVATAGGGRFYLATKAAKLPAIFTQDVAVMSRSAIEEVTFVPEMKPGEEILRGFAPSEFPALFAYCLADPRPLARVGLVSPKRDPILATWQYGLGTSLAFTSDAQARWASRWVGWDGFGRFWAQAVRGLSRKASQNDYQLSVSQVGGKGVIRLKATDKLGNPINANEMTVKVSSPTGDAQDVQLTQEGPGEFSGSFAAQELGSYIVTVAENAPGGEKRVSANGFSVPYPPEYRSQRTNSPLLTSVAETTGGLVLKQPEQALRPIKVPGESIHDIWAWFVLAAAILLPFDVANRRLALPFGEIFGRAWGRVWGRKPVPVQQPVAISRLQQAKSRARTTQDDPVKVEVEAKSAQRAPVQPGHVSAATKLLAERRRRKGGDGP